MATPRWSLVDGVEPVADVSNVYGDTGELEVDGYLGVQSVTAWQRALDTFELCQYERSLNARAFSLQTCQRARLLNARSVDGFVSGQPWECWGNTPRLVSVERVAEPYGSQLVSAIQMVVGADVDGLMGPQTVRCLQAWLNAHGFDCGEVDGVLGPRKAMAVQRSLNAGAWS